MIYVIILASLLISSFLYAAYQYGRENETLTEDEVHKLTRRIQELEEQQQNLRKIIVSIDTRILRDEFEKRQKRSSR